MLGRGMIKGLWVTLQHFVSTYTKKPKRFPNRYLPDGILERQEPSTQSLLTLQYPYERYRMFPRFKGALVHLRDPETGQARCTGCMACEKACPHGVISIQTEGKGRERKITSYTYNLGRCIFCRLCVEACRFNAIEMSHNYELASTSNDLVMTMDDMLRMGDKSDIRYSGEAWD